MVLVLFTLRVALHVENGGDGLVVLSDREKGIYNALKKSFPPAQHSFCVFHIQKNVKTAYKTALNGLLFKEAKAWHKNDFRAALEEMKSFPKRRVNMWGNPPRKMGQVLFPRKTVWPCHLSYGGVDEQLAERGEGTSIRLACSAATFEN